MVTEWPEVLGHRPPLLEAWVVSRCGAIGSWRGSVTMGQVVLSVGQRQNVPWLHDFFFVSRALVFDTHDSQRNFLWTIYSLWVTFKTSGQSSTLWPILEIWQAFFVQRLHDDYKQSLIDADCPNPLIMAAMLLGRADVRVEMGKLEVAEIEVIRTAVIRVVNFCSCFFCEMQLCCTYVHQISLGLWCGSLAGWFDIGLFDIGILFREVSLED